jgi:hypothetical protein
MSRPANALCEANLMRNWYVLFYAEATMTENNISPSINLAEHSGHSGQKIIEARLAGIRPATNLKVSNRFLLLGLFYVLLVMLSTPAMATPIHVLFERDVDGTAGNELAVVSYPTLTDLVNNTSSFTQFTQVDVSGAFSVGGFDYDFDDDISRVLFERDMDGTAGNELAFVSYPTLTNLISNTSSFTQFTQVDVSGAFSVGGFYTESKQGPPSQPVSEPATLILFGSGLLAMTLLKSRWRSNLVK